MVGNDGRTRTESIFEVGVKIWVCQKDKRLREMLERMDETGRDGRWMTVA